MGAPPPPPPRMARALREALIEQVQRRPVLYDTRRDDHRETELRDRAWLDIAECLQINSEVLKREWKILRDSLRQALNKRSVRGRRSGMPAQRWYFESKMSFLVPHMTKRAAFSADGADEEGECPTRAGTRAVAEARGPELGGAGGGARAADDGLELFFASVCACARALPRVRQAALKRQVLDALLQAEAECDSDD